MGPAEMLSPGTTIAGYRIDGVLGEGGMGVVYEATQLSLDRKVALKVLAARLGQDDDFRRRFRREGRLQAAIDHPSIVTVHEAGESEQGLFLAMRLVRGRTLKELIAAGALDPGRTVRILRPIAAGLDAAHGAGLIHRDVKPHNILVGPRDDAYLGDFGLTKSPDDPGLTRSGEFLGTPNYISPEQVRGEPATAASDVYALGAVLFECLTGVVPFPKTSHAAVLYAHVSAPPPAVTALRPDLPPAIDDVIARAMAKDPAERPPSAAVLVEEAERTLGDLAVGPAVPVGAAAQGAAVPTTPGDGPSATRAATLTPPRARVAVTARLPDPTSATVPEPVRDPGPRPAPAGGRAGARRLRLVVALAVAAAAAGGLLLGRAGPPEAPVSRSLETGGLRLAVPVSWRPAEPAEAVDLRGLSAVVSVSPGVPEGAGLVAGRAKLASSPLLPVGLRRSVSEVPPPERVRLAGGPAHRYGPMRLRRAPLLVTAYVLPTTRGAAVAACVAPVGADAAATACERVAGTLRADVGDPVDLGPSERYARRLSRAVSALDGRRRTARRQLRSAPSPRVQARQADRLADAFATAAAAVRRLDAPAAGGDAHADVRRSLSAAAAAYARLRRAATAGAAARFERAAADVRRAEAAVHGALRALRRLGYRTD